ncbi:hypothetical protein FSP39_007571 [Pinctada imbricata]|uniref:Uncharacterized protein n=1 Tax=Pinctada imbricata TaxID=66713 RepID=A0AA89C6J1_PINIB|nr:hypothetical protein FSP39_007571 [Pinctada imbricata]
MSGCPSTSLEVKTSSERLNCVQPEVYHCLRDQVGKKTEKCIKPSWIQRGLCAEYNTIAERLDAKGCQLSRGLCPDKAYLSNDVISFYCFNVIFEKMPDQKRIDDDSNAKMPDNA